MKLFGGIAFDATGNFAPQTREWRQAMEGKKPEDDHDGRTFLCGNPSGINWSPTTDATTTPKPPSTPPSPTLMGLSAPPTPPIAFSTHVEGQRPLDTTDVPIEELSAFFAGSTDERPARLQPCRVSEFPPSADQVHAREVGESVFRALVEAALAPEVDVRHCRVLAYEGLSMRMIRAIGQAYQTTTEKTDVDLIEPLRLIMSLGRPELRSIACERVVELLNRLGTAPAVMILIVRQLTSEGF